MEMMEQHLTNPKEIKSLGRLIGQHFNEDQLEAYISEVEQLYVKPMLGDKLFLLLLNEENQGIEPYKTLLYGGVYSDQKGDEYMFKGLRVAMSYYVYAQTVMTGDFQSTRYGMVIKDSDNSTHLSDKERSDAYNNALEVANNYLQECLTYCKRVNLLTGHKGVPRTSGSVRIRKIG